MSIKNLKALLLSLFLSPALAQAAVIVNPSTRLSTTTVAPYAILNQNSLQSGSTFYVSSGTVKGQFTAGANQGVVIKAESVNATDSIGIGKQNPDGRLHIKPSASGEPALILEAGSTQGVSLRLKDENGADKVYYGFFPSSVEGPDLFFVDSQSSSRQFAVSADSSNPGTHIGHYGSNSTTGTANLNVYGSAAIGDQLVANSANIPGDGLWVQTGISGATFTVRSLLSKSCLGTDGSGNVIEGTCTGGSGASLIVTTGPVTGNTGAYTSTQTIVLLFDNSTFLNQLLYGGTDFVRLNPSSVTLQGQGVLLSTQGYVPWSVFQSSMGGSAYLPRSVFNSSAPATYLSLSSAAATYLQTGSAGDMILASSQTSGAWKNFTSPAGSTFTYGVVAASFTANGPGGGTIDIGNSAGSAFVSLRSHTSMSSGYNIVTPSTAGVVNQVLEIGSVSGSTLTLVPGNKSVTLPNLFGGVAPANAYDFGGATSLEAPNGTGPTIDTTGEIGVDTTAGQFIFFDGINANVLAATQTQHMTIESPAVGDYPFFFQAHTALTVTSGICISSSATSATIQVDECSSAGVSCTAINTAVACTTTGANFAITNSAIDAGDWIRAKVTAVSGTPGWTAVSLRYRETRQ